MLTVRHGGDSQDVFPFHVRRDARESELSLLEKADAEALALAGGLQFGDDPLAAGTGVAGSGRAEPLWTWLLGSLLGLMVVESALAARLTRRRMATAPSPV